ncbi:hypothetical protein EHS25_007982 [Saitozyma podzolica]|uniref:Uncharacterized protein n=1 Tax=Saitozyma podzolica TaxID=1890683 RepID=A0A427YN28_9TREE|nr:hypothetical protein EHS25_007982 [Saitozyma podzolica]
MSTPSSSRTVQPAFQFFQPEPHATPPIPQHQILLPHPPHPQEAFSSVLVHPDATQQPIVQVIHPTPTKKKVRRRSVGATSSSTSNESLMQASSLLRTSRSTLDVKLDDEHDNVAEDDSDRERLRFEEEAKKNRAREKGKIRQRRKRERDKKAREDAKAASHLPIPSRTPSSTNLPSLTANHPLSSNMSPSMPSSASSTYSSLPFSASYYSLSPGQPFGMSSGSNSVSGQSSPNVLFSPAISTPGIGYEGFSWTEGTGSALEMSSLRRRPSGHERARAYSSSLAMTLPRRQSQDVPILAPVVPPAGRPEKRRKSEPRVDEARGEVGLGVIIGDGGMNASWPRLDAESSRPKPRRTASGGAVLETSEWSSGRSPTPPPVPSVPIEFRKQSQPTIHTPAAPSSEAAFFASWILLFLSAENNEQGTAALKSQLSLSQEDLESMRPDLAVMYDKWKLERGMSRVTLDENSLRQVASGQSSRTETRLSPIASPPTTSQPLESFVTPSAPRARRALPVAQDSPLAQVTEAHSRTRSMSSNSLMNRGLTINPPPHPQPVRVVDKWDSPAAPKGSDSPSQSSLQTPSTGQGGFAIPPSDIQPPQWRSATDPSHLRMVGSFSHAGDWHSATQTKPDQAGLDSPLAMTHKSASADMAPPPLQFEHAPPSHQDSTGMQPIVQPHFAAGQVAPFTPATRLAYRQAIPYTPPTPMPLKGGEAPMWYAPSFGVHPVPADQQHHATPQHQVQHHHIASGHSTPQGFTDHQHQQAYGFPPYEGFGQ